MSNVDKVPTPIIPTNTLASFNKFIIMICEGDIFLDLPKEQQVYYS